MGLNLRLISAQANLRMRHTLTQINQLMHAFSICTVSPARILPARFFCPCNCFTMSGHWVLHVRNYLSSVAEREYLKLHDLLEAPNCLARHYLRHKCLGPTVQSAVCLCCRACGEENQSQDWSALPLYILRRRRNVEGTTVPTYCTQILVNRPGNSQRGYFGLSAWNPSHASVLLPLSIRTPTVSH